VTDLVVVELTKTGLWAGAFTLVVVLFRAEIRSLLSSLAAFNVAGASFTLRDRKQTLESYVLLSETFIELLSKSDQIERLLMLLSPPQLEKLSTFALRYTKELGDGAWNEEMLRNVAVLLFRSGRSQLAVELYDALLVRRPDSPDLLNLRALAQLVTRLPLMVQQAYETLEPLSRRYPENMSVRFNLAAAKSLLGDHHGSMQILNELLPLGYYLNEQGSFADPLLHHTRTSLPDEFEALKVAALMTLNPSVKATASSIAPD